MAYRDPGEGFERDIGLVPDIVKQYVVYLYRHIRLLLLARLKPLTALVSLDSVA
jgi:hypothetical protein